MNSKLKVLDNETVAVNLIKTTLEGIIQINLKKAGVVCSKLFLSFTFLKVENKRIIVGFC